MSCWALVPVKARSAGKRRLAQALPEAVRARLIQVMLEQVLATLRACPEIHSVAVMTPDRDRLPPDIAVLPDAGAEMNASLTRALATLQARGARRVAIVFPDLPQLLPGDVAALVQAAPEGAVGLAPDHSGQGTNAVCVSLPTPFDFHFGPGASPCMSPRRKDWALSRCACRGPASRSTSMSPQM